MTRNPISNALAAAMYIIVVASVMYYGPKMAEQHDSVLIPIAVLSLFVLSAATMGYLFLYQPVLLYLDGQKTEATKLFMRTFGVFAIITVIFLATMFLVNV